MAIDTESARFFLTGVRHGVRYAESLTLGRQHFLLSHAETARLMADCGLRAAEHADMFRGEYPMYAEPFWKLLGASRVETLDMSEFEGATLVHDLNRPVPEAWKLQFDAVCDVGTLEHVFDFLTAVRNCLEMVKVGGHFLAVTPANNLLGHGFYQFSPELFYRILSPAHGFEVERMVAVEYGPRRRWFDVPDPAVAGARVQLVNRYPVMLMVQARKTGLAPLGVETPQQSDYVRMWADWSRTRGPLTPALDPAHRPGLKRLKRWLLERVPGLCRMAEGLACGPLNGDYAFRNRAIYRPIAKRSASKGTKPDGSPPSSTGNTPRGSETQPR